MVNTTEQGWTHTHWPSKNREHISMIDQYNHYIRFYNFFYN